MTAPKPLDMEALYENVGNAFGPRNKFSPSDPADRTPMVVESAADGFSSIRTASLGEIVPLVLTELFRQLREEGRVPKELEERIQKERLLAGVIVAGDFEAHIAQLQEIVDAAVAWFQCDELTDDADHVAAVCALETRLSEYVAQQVTDEAEAPKNGGEQ